MASVALQHFPRQEIALALRFNGAVTGKQYTSDPLGRVVVDTQDAPTLLAKGFLYANINENPSSPSAGAGVIDFGAFPGSGFASVTIAALDISDANAVLYGFIAALATADHSADEHLVDPPMVTAVADGNGNVIISGVSRANDLMVPPVNIFGFTQTFSDTQPMPYGKWSVGWGFMQ